jgi:putative nucleotidyltransferase with HDIG domain
MFPGKRKSKSGRPQLKPNGSVELGHSRDERDRSRLLRCGIIAAAILATAALVHGNGPPFTFRIGQQPARPILVNVESFKRRDPVRTNVERRAKAEAVTPLLTNDPASIEGLQDELIDLVDAVSKVRDRALLDESITSRWDLKESAFLDIHAAGDTPERLEDLHRQIGQAFTPIRRNGVLWPDALPRSEQSYPRVRVRQADQGPGELEDVNRDVILRGRIVRPDGPVATEFARAFTSPKLGEALFTLIAEKLAGTPTLRFEEKLTKQEREVAHDSVPEAYRDYGRGDVLVEQGELITEDHLAALELEHATANAQRSLGARLWRIGSVLALVTALFALMGYSIIRTEPRIIESPRRLAVTCALVVLALGIARLLALQPWDAEIVPVALTGMILALAYSPQVALMVTFALSIFTSLALGQGLGHFLVLMGGTAAAVLPLREVRTRTKPIQVGLYAAIGYFVLTWATGLFQSQALGLVATDSFWRAGWGLMAGFFLGGLLPFIERGFGIVTGISLLELGDINHPLLQELVRRAPGTHNHSVTVGTIAEAAAEPIGANGLLVRIGAYFHDIGKMVKPHYFVENQVGDVNRHANLNPAMSTLIIIGHVKDGYELGRQQHLPQPILDLIEQHHGTTLVEYFYREAARRCDQDPDAGDVQESAFRYPGPKPQTREAGLLMIADAVESASRTLSEPTPSRIESLVAELVKKRLEDGQLDECGLTLREIAQVRESLVKSLIGIYHGRVKYPEQRTA